MSLETICLPCNKSDYLLNKFDSCFEKRIKAPKNANKGHEHIGCLILDSKMSWVLCFWDKSVWS